ncbi:Rha family transcriptional regulator [Desulfogranum mediterraneum]|uniref:Rha family transcriptional regulator n=1 Tax=Desulfogranum mediterraneum TaxID=160661 RepID=UPI00068692F3|nr:Rha family transcriptional regulator [Desulfogranum mediterraneum]
MNSDQKMSSRQIAERTGKEHKHVMRDIRTLVDQEAIHESSFGLMSYPVEIGNGAVRQSQMYQLDFHATMTLITGYRADLRAAVIARWIELETLLQWRRTTMSELMTINGDLKEVNGEMMMSSKQIAEPLCEPGDLPRHDNVKRAMERLELRELIVVTPMEEEQIDSMGRAHKVKVYYVNEDHSYIVVAQLSPEFTAKLVHEWRRLTEENHELPP